MTLRTLQPLESPESGTLYGTLAFLAGLFLFAGVVSAQERHQTFRIPFQTVNGMILLDAVVNAKPASLLLDTGAKNTIVSPQAAGLATVQLRSLQATKAGTGAEGDYITRDVDLRLSNRHWIARKVLVMDCRTFKRAWELTLTGSSARTSCGSSSLSGLSTRLKSSNSSSRQGRLACLVLASGAMTRWWFQI